MLKRSARSYGEILGDPRVVGVHIATPNETRYEIATKAVAAEKNVLLEKPMCLMSSDTFKLRAPGKQRRRTVRAMRKNKRILKLNRHEVENLVLEL